MFFNYFDDLRGGTVGLGREGYLKKKGLEGYLNMLADSI